MSEHVQTGSLLQQLHFDFIPKACGASICKCNCSISACLQICKHLVMLLQPSQDFTVCRCACKRRFVCVVCCMRTCSSHDSPLFVGDSIGQS